MSKIIKAFLIVLVIIISVFLIFKGTQNKIDPLWTTIDSVFIKNNYDIKEKSEVLDSVFYNIQKDPYYRQTKFKAINLIDKPFLPTTEYRKFIDLINAFYKNKKILISGVSGAGKTTITDRVAKLIAADTNRILYLQCVEQMSVEYNKQYVGYYENNKFVKGKLIDFFEKSYKDSLHNYVFIVDDIDKIYPSTIFGSALWNEMDNPEYNNAIEGYTNDIKIPPNFYLMSITHDGVGSTIELNAEHYRRLTNDNPYHIDASYLEFYMGMKDDTLRKIKKSKDLSDSLKKEYSKNIKANKFDLPTRDSILRVLYFFAKANQMIEKKYENSYTLGQWSSVRKQNKPSKLNKSMQFFLDHVNAFKPKEQLKAEDFESIIFTINNKGLLENSYFFYRVYDKLVSLGILNEISVSILFGVVSALYGITVFRKKKKFIKNIIKDTIKPYNDFKESTATFDESRGMLLLIQKNIEEYIVTKKINFSEANYLLLTISDQIKQLENLHQLNSVSIDLKKMFDDFMSDDILNEKEYSMLLQFLNSIRSTISKEAYDKLKGQIDDTYSISLAKSKLDNKK